MMEDGTANVTDLTCKLAQEKQDLVVMQDDELTMMATMTCAELTNWKHACAQAEGKVIDLTMDDDDDDDGCETIEDVVTCKEEQ